MTSKPQVLIIGMGNIGRRTMQALLKLGMPISLVVVDRKQEFLDLARGQAAEIEGSDKHAVEYALDMKNIKSPLDLVIIATTSAPRFDVLTDLLDRYEVRNLVMEKFLFQDIAHYEAARLILERNKVSCWVSCPRPVWPGYVSLKQLVDGETGNVCIVSGSNWNLASNAVHFIDCFARISNEAVTEIDGRGLDPTPFNNRREGYREVSGTIVARGSNGGVLCLSCDRDGTLPISVEWISGVNRFHIQEAAQIMRQQSGSDVSDKPFPMLMASELTAVYHDILTTNDCGLTRYAASAEHHLKVIETLNTVFFDDGQRGNPCPIT